MKKPISFTLIMTWLLLFYFVGFSQPLPPDSSIAQYQKSTVVMGNAISMGSDTMSNLMALWLEAFNHIYPLVSIEIEGKGSVTAPPALIEGLAQLGPMSRPMTIKELDAFRSKYNVKPIAIRTSLDALAVYVHRDNPLNCINLDELDAIFSTTRNRGYPENIDLWGQLGLQAEWKNLPISIYGRNTASGTYGVFKTEDLKRGDFKDEVKEQPGSASVVQNISQDRAGIGYSGIGYNTSGVKVLDLTETTGDSCFAAVYENVVNRKYPFTRYLYIYTVKLPNKPIDPLIREFLKFILSNEGQSIVIQAGFFPLTGETVKKELEKLTDL
jgi:phosphate transport system substrate-binding protein